VESYILWLAISLHSLAKSLELERNTLKVGNFPVSFINRPMMLESQQHFCVFSFLSQQKLKPSYKNNKTRANEQEKPTHDTNSQKVEKQKKTHTKRQKLSMEMKSYEGKWGKMRTYAYGSKKKNQQQQQLNSLLDQAWRINKGMEYREGGRVIRGRG